MIGPFVAACAQHYDAGFASADTKMAIIAPQLYGILAIEIVCILGWIGYAIYQRYWTRGE